MPPCAAAAFPHRPGPPEPRHRNPTEAAAAGSHLAGSRVAAPPRGENTATGSPWHDDPVAASTSSFEPPRR
uniref:Uncharacterized protein n=1 Tax=Arundo donax TaxID=35708 RepID=A0A0A9AWV9_ARUDO